MRRDTREASFTERFASKATERARREMLVSLHFVGRCHCDVFDGSVDLATGAPCRLRHGAGFNDTTR